MVDHPGRTAGLYLRKLLFFFGQYEIPQVESLPFERRYAALLRLPLPGMALLAALAVFSILLLWRRNPHARYLVATSLILALAVSIFFVTARFRIPAVPFLVVLAGGGIAEALSRDRSQAGTTAVLAGAGLLVWGLLSLNLTRVDSSATLGQNFFRAGVVLEKQGKIDEAISTYQEALHRDPTLGKAEVNLGTLLARQGHLDEARRHLERGVQLDPMSVIGLVNLGQLHQLQDRPDDALEAFRQAERVDPGAVSPRENAALFLYDRGRIPEAGSELEEILRRSPPGSAPAARAGALLSILHERGAASGWETNRALRLGDLRLAQGDSAGAVRLYQVAASPAADGSARPGRDQALRMLARLGASG